MSENEPQAFIGLFVPDSSDEELTVHFVISEDEDEPQENDPSAEATIRDLIFNPQFNANDHRNILFHLEKLCADIHKGLLLDTKGLN